MKYPKFIIGVFIAVLLLTASGTVIYQLVEKSIKGETASVDTKNQKESTEEKEMYIKVNDKTLTVALENNSSASALIEKLKQGDITVEMSDYANFEKVGALGFDLPRNDKQITTRAGDVILYQGNQITIYYDTNSWNFTKLGHITGITQKELKDVLGNGDVTVILSLTQ